MTTEREAFWKDYYEQMATKATPWLDYSNERVQAQSLALALEASGPVQGRTCLDVGCGWGQLALCLCGLGARETTGLDLAEPMIRENRSKHPQIRWIVGSLQDLATDARYDRVFLIEVLQYVPAGPTLKDAWRLVAPGGRLIAVAPNRACPLVARAAARFSGNYGPPGIADFAATMQSLPDVESWFLRGLAFRDDQTLIPYSVSEWTRAPNWPCAPNRLQFVAKKTEQ
jgi:2-polyprenyl-3-methyl-5-hydroxy-6-metoxy-1,4-benzoquinol methylase